MADSTGNSVLEYHLRKVVRDLHQIITIIKWSPLFHEDVKILACATSSSPINNYPRWSRSVRQRLSLAVRPFEI
jgi:hypothetical protein